MLLRQAREQAGLSLEAAARLARVSVDYLRRVEMSGDCSFPLAKKLSRIYSCSANLFILQIGQTTTAQRSKQKDRSRRAHVFKNTAQNGMGGGG
jgi:transcriptional regulator with XRE-family HTH domain